MKEQPIKVLLIDDEKDYCIALSGEARHENIQIGYVQNLEDGLISLKNDLSIQFVILDGKCMIEEGQTIPKPNFVMKAIRAIDKFADGNNTILPFCVNTGFMDDLKASLEGNAKVFDKGHDSKPMFEFIKSEVENLPITLLLRKYRGPFDMFSSGLLASEHQQKFIKLLEEMESDKFDKSSFNAIREIFEDCLKGLQNKYKYFPAEFFHADGRPNLAFCTMYLSGRKTTNKNSGNEFAPPLIAPPHISWTLSYLKELSSILSHAYEHNFENYSFYGVMNALMEIMTWLPKFTKENFK